jgi:hypothetical protein
MVSGVATLANVGWALIPAEMLETGHLHKIAAEMLGPARSQSGIRLGSSQMSDGWQHRCFTTIRAATWPGSILLTMFRERLPLNSTNRQMRRLPFHI